MFCCARLVTIKKTPGSVGFRMVDGQRVRRAPSQPSASRSGQAGATLDEAARCLGEMSAFRSGRAGGASRVRVVARPPATERRRARPLRQSSLRSATAAHRRFGAMGRSFNCLQLGAIRGQSPTCAPWWVWTRQERFGCGVIAGWRRKNHATRRNVRATGAQRHFFVGKVG